MVQTEENFKMSSNGIKQITPSVRKQDLQDAEMIRNGKWATAITLMSFSYGYIVIGNQLPKDPRQRSWFVSMSPIPTLLFCLAYIAIVTWLGPKFMKNREPVKGLKYVVMFHNGFQVLFKLWLFTEGGMNGWFSSYSLFCEPCNFSNEPKALRMMNAAYWFYIGKLIDLIDTLFFVVHKKYDHVTLLHVSHHAFMPISTWFGVIYQPGGHHSFLCVPNVFVHILTYLYYLLSAMGPRIRPYLWWKKYITTLQILELLFIFMHTMVTMLFLDCNVPRQFHHWIGIMALVFLIMFTHFYIKEYRSKEEPLLLQRGLLDEDYPKKHIRKNLKIQEESRHVGTYTGAINKFASASKQNYGDVGDESSPRNRVPCL